MPEFRHDPLSGRWVIIAEDRANRPSEFNNEPACQSIGRCPFCAGNEQDTPAAILEYAGQDSAKKAWQVRVIPNKFPAVTLDAGVHSASSLSGQNGNSSAINRVVQPGIGIHEVIIESAHHVTSFTELTDEQARLALHAYRDRLRALGQNPQLNYGLLFKNCGGGGGATLEHVHSQLLTTSIVPLEVEQELRSATQHFEQTGRCLFCDLLHQELGEGSRVVTETPTFVAFCPFASRFPYEVCLLPRTHACRFEQTDSIALTEVAALLRRLLEAIEKRFPEAAYNYWIHTAPFHVECDASYHWHWEVIPRITRQAGYEWGTGCFVNPISPEQAAKQLREALLR